MLEFNRDAGVVLAADLGATHCRLAVADLAGTPLVEFADDLEIAEGPEAVLGWVQGRIGELLEEAGRDRSEVWGVGIGVPGPVDFSRGRVVNPPVMPGWHGVDIPRKFSKGFGGVPVFVDNDANLMALGEHRIGWPGSEHLLFVKVGTGVGCGIIGGGNVHRGAQGAAGDIGHIRINGHDEAVCRCGNVACVEAVAGGWALVRRLRELGVEVGNSREVVGLVEDGDPVATRLLRRSGELLGEVISGAVSFFNPSVVVIGGDLARAHEQLLAGIRTVVYGRSLPLATRHLEVSPSKLGDRAGVFGAAAMVVERVVPAAAEGVAAERTG